MAKELYNLGEMPPLGEIPEKMHAWLIRPERFGTPMQAFQQEVVDIPPVADDEVLVYVMAAGATLDAARLDLWSGGRSPARPSDFHQGRRGTGRRHRLGDSRRAVALRAALRSV